MHFRIRFEDGSDTLYHADSSSLKKARTPKFPPNSRHTFFGSKSLTLAHHGVKGMKWGVHNEETQQKYGEIGNGGGGAIRDDDDADDNDKNPDSPDYVSKDDYIYIDESRPGEAQYYVYDRVEKEGPFGIKYKNSEKRYLDKQKVENGYYKKHDPAKTRIYSTYLEKEVDLNDYHADISSEGRKKLSQSGWVR